MHMVKNLLLAGFLAFSATAVVASSVSFAGDKKEEKCDKHGKTCKDGADCKAENCKHE